MPPTPPLRLAFLGAGGINRVHRDAVLAHPDRWRGVAVADPLRPAAQALAASLGPDARAFADPLELLGEMDGQIDAVLVTTPHHLHAPLAAEALRRGLPVLVEKPAACRAAELRALQALDRPGAFLQAGQMQRFGREENWIRRWLASPDFGQPRLFNVDIYQNIEGYVSSKPDAWILDGERAGGGIVISVAVHILDLLRFWLDDDFAEVTARGRFDPPFSGGAESTVAAVLATSRGVVGTLNCSYTAARCPYSQRTLLFGTRGTLAQHLDPIGGGYAGPYFTATDGGQPTTEWNAMYAGFAPVGPRVREDPSLDRLPISPFAGQLLAFADGVAAGRALENSLARNFNTLATIDALGRSLRSGRTETVEPL